MCDRTGGWRKTTVLPRGRVEGSVGGQWTNRIRGVTSKFARAFRENLTHKQYQANLKEKLSV